MGRTGLTKGRLLLAGGIACGLVLFAVVGVWIRDGWASLSESKGEHAKGALLREQTQGPLLVNPKVGDAMAFVARGVLAGKQMPRIESFPEVLRTRELNEVLVIVRRGSKPVIWRSAKRQTPAGSLLHATEAIRERWGQRRDSFGGPLGAQLSELGIEVWSLERTDRLENAQAKTLEGKVTPTKSVGFEYRNLWRYALPEHIEAPRTGQRVRAALVQLLEESKLAPKLIDADALRVFRFRLRLLGKSKAP